MKSTLERINPDDEHEKESGFSLQLHLERYQFAGKHLKPGLIVDIACGLGYGSYLLATEYAHKVSNILGIDVDQEAIRFARAKYRHPSIQFIVDDAFTFVPHKMLDSIVSLETIEHLRAPGEFIKRISNNLVKGGRFIASVPITPSMDANPYHLHDFKERQLKKIFDENGMKEIASMVQVQPFNPFSIRKGKDRMQEVRKNIASYYLHHPGKFILRLCSLISDGFRNKYLVIAFEKYSS